MRPFRRGLAVLTTLILALLPIAGVEAAPAPASCAAAAVPLASGSATPLRTTDAVKLRRGPGLACGVVEVLGVGTRVTPRGGPVAADGHRWLPVVVGTVQGWVAADYLTPDFGRVAVLMYHHLDVPGTQWSVTSDQLDAQMAWLQAHGYASVTISQLAAAAAGKATLPPKAVVISDDDGYPEAPAFAAILKRHGFVGTYYLPTQIALTPHQIRALETGGGEVCAHTVDHANLAKLDAAGQRWEIGQNQRDLEAILHHPVRCFAYPYGAYNADTVPILTALGFVSAVDVGGGPVNLNDPIDPYHIPRVQALGTLTLAAFAASVSAA
jgi:peptidoglycan/xylan/chitin deacetylase (PgdA/CDA1 family)